MLFEKLFNKKNNQKSTEDRKMYTIGIDLGGMSIKTGVVDENLNIIGTGVLPTNVPRPAEELAEDIAKTCFMAVVDAGLTMDDISSAGIGSPGTINPVEGILEYANNLHISNFKLAEAISKRIGVPVRADNDANCAALGEAVGGAAKGAKNAVCVTLGTGVGAGIIIDGKIFSGSNYAGGEIGHNVIKFDGHPCNCGRKGCWEAYASMTALIRMTKHEMIEHPESKMWEIAGSVENVNGITSFKAAREGDEVAAKLVAKYIDYVSVGLVNIINTFQPDVVCIGGAVSKEGEYLLAPIREFVERERYTKYSAKQTKVVAATLGNDAGIIGAAMLYTQ